ncbi:MAG: hypothetical protein ORN21_01640 [Methylophilaceae bacterium]|nr:hypothetical protein [Methylophilaceae bacterium]
MIDTAVKRKLILDFFEKYGEKATIEAFQVSRRTLYAWRAKLACTVRQYCRTVQWRTASEQ